MDKQPSPIKFSITLFFIIAIVTIPFSWNYYQDDVNKLKDAYADKTKLFPPYEWEINKWEWEDRQLQIKQKEKEIVLLRMNISIPENMDQEVLAHFDKYPKGHNPPQKVIQMLVDDIYKKINNLIYWDLIISGIISITFYIWARNENKQGLIL